MGETVPLNQSLRPHFLFSWLLQSGKSWISRGCSRNCNCMAGVIRCQKFQCPSGTFCQDSGGDTSNCAKICKELPWGKVGGVCLGLKGKRGLVPWVFEVGNRVEGFWGPTAQLGPFSVLASPWLVSHVDLGSLFYYFGAWHAQ